MSDSSSTFGVENTTDLDLKDVMTALRHACVNWRRLGTSSLSDEIRVQKNIVRYDFSKLTNVLYQIVFLIHFQWLYQQLIVACFSTSWHFSGAVKSCKLIAQCLPVQDKHP